MVILCTHTTVSKWSSSSLAHMSREKQNLQVLSLITALQTALSRAPVICRLTAVINKEPAPWHYKLIRGETQKTSQTLKMQIEEVLKHTLSLISNSLSWLVHHCAAAALSSFQLCARFFRDFSLLVFECLMLSSVHDLVRKSDCSFNCDNQHRMKLLLRYQGWSPIETMSKNCVHTCTFWVDSELNLVQNKSVLLKAMIRSQSTVIWQIFLGSKWTRVRASSLCSSHYSSSYAETLFQESVCLCGRAAISIFQSVQLNVFVRL